jgi:NTP pyrophosphatase (non-canonical NTP hydrolase)
VTLAEGQALVDAWIRENGGYWDEKSMMLRLAEETGELAREYNHRFGAKKKKKSEGEKALADEMGDVLFILICMANQQGIDLDQALRDVLVKIGARDAGRWTS